MSAMSPMSPMNNGIEFSKARIEAQSQGRRRARERGRRAI